MSKCQEKMNDYVIKKLKKNESSIIIDIGAYIGSISIGFYNEIEGSKIYCIEACPSNYEVLKKNTKPYEGIIPINIAISADSGEIDFFIAKHKKSRGGSSQANSLFKAFLDDKDWANPVGIKVKAQTLDEFCSDNDIAHIDFLKINCEGCEYKIFESSTLDFLNKTDIIYIEMHTKCSRFLSKEFNLKRKKIEEILTKYGFKKIISSSTSISKKHVEQVWTKI